MLCTQIVFDHSLAEAVQGIALREDLLSNHIRVFRSLKQVLTCQYFIMLQFQNFKTSLSMFVKSYQITSEILQYFIMLQFQNVKTSRNMFEKSYQITSDFKDFRTLKQVLTCYYFVIMQFQSLKTGQNMIVESYQITSEFLEL